MGEQTGIEWCHHTFNPWRGCTKVSAGCAHCYAETLSHRNPAVLGVWGDKGTRPEAAEAYWLQALAWYKAAVEAGEVRRVFCGSLMDVGEDRPELDPLRDRLMALIALTPFVRLPEGRRAGLHWLWLTKRPSNLLRYLTAPGLQTRILDAARWWLDRRPDLRSVPLDGLAQLSTYPHLAVGVSVENQRTFDERVPIAMKIGADTTFLSMEPLLGPVDLGRLWPMCWSWPARMDLKEAQALGLARRRPQALVMQGARPISRIDWIIVGGESGADARPMHDEWARSLRDQAQEANVPFLFKQWGEWLPEGQMDHLPDVGRHSGHVWLDRYEPMHEDDEPEGYSAFRVGKKAAGRLLDGRTWDEVPTP